MTNLPFPQITVRRGGPRYDTEPRPWVGCAEPTVQFHLAETVSYKQTYTVRQLARLLLDDPTVPEAHIRAMLTAMEMHAAELDTINDGELIRDARTAPPHVVERRWAFR